VIASEHTLLQAAVNSLPDGSFTEAELYERLRGIGRLSTGLEGLVARLVSSGGLIRLSGNRFRRGALSPEPDAPARAVETRRSAA